MKKPNFSRRQFLRGAGGFALALPFLPSLLCKQARGAESLGLPNFVAMATQHGGIWPTNMYPEDSRFTQSFNYAGRDCRWGAMQAEVVDNIAKISPVLSASANTLTPELLAKLSILRGIDIPWYIAHHTGGHLGNYARNDGNGGTGRAIQEFPMPTIDQVMAWSDKFYPDMSMVTQRAMAIGLSRMSYNYASPSTKTGEIQAVLSYTDNLQMFERLFKPGESSNSPSPLAVDRVLENYQRVINGNRRLSSSDRGRLEEHMERLYEIERRVNILPECAQMAEPSIPSTSYLQTSDYSYNPETMLDYWSLHNDIVSMAISCGVCRVFSMNAPDTFSTYQGNWHQDIAHQATGADGEAQNMIAGGHQVFFEGVFLDLAQKMMAISNGRGGSVLDDSLIVWTQESGIVTHQNISVPIVAAGSACGTLNTGRYIDYRRLETSYDYNSDGYPEFLVDHPGLHYNQYLGTVLQSMGMSPAEYETNYGAGYGYYFVDPNVTQDYVEAGQLLSEPLPIFTI